MMHAPAQQTDEHPAAQGVFVGRFVHSLDPKKRLTIPSGWRAQVRGTNSLYIIPDVQEKCLCVFPSSEMHRRLAERRHTSIADRKARQFARVLASQSDLVAWDSQGRIRVKDELLDFAGLADRVVLLGAFESFELWNPDDLKAAGGLDRSRIEEAAAHVGF